MKKIYFIFNILLIALPAVYPQEYKNIIVKAGTSILDYFPPSERYRYPDFMVGRVILRNNVVTPTRLNYNMLTDEMQFISQPSDTFSIGDPKNLKYVVFEKDTFVYNGGFLELLYQSPDIMIAVKDYVKFIGIEKYGAYGTTSTTSSISTYNSLLTESQAYNLTVAEDINLKRTIEYYISLDGGANYVMMIKFQLKKLYPGHSKEINKFFGKEVTALDDPDYLQQVVAFLRSI